ncbi:hypothetical protein ABZT16_11505 [Streptomyces flaveolus]|uniref:hypothetical protein n=1 Tax=Streptomyces flaveolus TaxID=67297 RepID=UPI0033B0DDCE
MDLTARYVADGRRVIADVEATDITNPDLSRVNLVRIVTRLTETLRTATDHAERLNQSLTQAREENAGLEGQVHALHAALTEASAAA